MITIKSKALSDAVRSLKRFAKKGTAGDGIWTVSASRLLVDWCGAHFEFEPVERVEPADDQSDPAVVALDEGSMIGIHAIVSRKGDVTIRVEDGRLYFDNFSIACRVKSQAVESLVAANATKYDVLLLHYRYPASLIDEAGIADGVADAQEKAEASVSRAARALDWLGVDATTLASWVDAHLAARARGKTTFDMTQIVVADRSGQFEMFE